MQFEASNIYLASLTIDKYTSRRHRIDHVLTINNWFIMIGNFMHKTKILYCCMGIRCYHTMRHYTVDVNIYLYMI